MKKTKQELREEVAGLEEANAGLKKHLDDVANANYDAPWGFTRDYDRIAANIASGANQSRQKDNEIAAMESRVQAYREALYLVKGKKIPKEKKES